jgi:hypothetical protein
MKITDDRVGVKDLASHEGRYLSGAGGGGVSVLAVLMVTLCRRGAEKSLKML